MHVITRHPELLAMIDEILDIVAQPDVITPDRTRGRWRYWQAGIGPTRWLFVVVDWRPARPEIVTAFGRGRVRL